MQNDENGQGHHLGRVMTVENCLRGSEQTQGCDLLFEPFNLIVAIAQPVGLLATFMRTTL